MSSTTDAAAVERSIERLRGAADRLEEAERRVETAGEDDLRTVAKVVEDVETLLARYEERATGTGDFQAFVEFEEKVANLVEGLPGDLPEREAFEDAGDHLDQRRLKDAHFERAREALAPARDLAARLDERRDARDAYREARRAATERRRRLDAEIEDLERVRRLGEADLSAPTGRLREPIETYDDAVADAFDQFKREASAREVLALVERTREYPLVTYRQPPEDLLAFVRDHPAGAETIPDLLEYADYSRSKLSHYVEDPDALKRAVATQQTYLRRLDAEPLTVGWPPPDAPTLRARTREYESVVHRFAGEDVTAALRTVRRLPVETDYERLREAAVAAAELDDDEKRLVERGELEARLADLRERRDELAAALEEHPER
ncbi:MAG: hypothetical protein V5A23_01670 [Halobacteriales archaeon]